MKKKKCVDVNPRWISNVSQRREPNVKQITIVGVYFISYPPKKHNIKTSLFYWRHQHMTSFFFFNDNHAPRVPSTTAVAKKKPDEKCEGGGESNN